MTAAVTIDRRFRGPPESANGGYACGLVARHIDAPAAQVTLRLPPPLGRELSLETGEDEAVELRDGDAVVAEGVPLESLELEVPDPPSLDAAAAAREASPLHHNHLWPMCFVCGPDRGTGDGLRVICGAVEGGEVVASPWETDETLATEQSGELATEVVWAALDCPSGLAFLLEPDAPVAALGRLAARIDADLRPGETYVAVGWPIARDGRKLHTGSALFGAGGELLACAQAVWIELQGDLLGAQR